MTIEELLNTEYWIIDILPKQVLADSAGKYFAVEEHLRKTQMPEIKKKHLDLILLLNCYRDISLEEEGEVNPPPQKIEEVMRNRYVNILIEDSMIISEPEDTHMTLFHPDEELLVLVRELAAGQGLYVWKGGQ